MQVSKVKELTPEYFFDEPYSFPLSTIIKKPNYVWELLSLKNEILQNMKPRIDGTVEEGAKIIGSVHIGKGTVIHPFAVVRGPAWIGENCSIRFHSLVRNNTVIGNNCTVGHGTEIKNSLMLDNAKMQGTYAGDSILGAHSRISSGSVLENRRFDQNEIKIKPSTSLEISETIHTGLKFFGCVLGDYSRLGGLSSTYPGTLIGKHTWILGNQHIGSGSQFLPSFKLIKNVNEKEKWKEKKPFLLTIGHNEYEWV